MILHSIYRRMFAANHSIGKNAVYSRRIFNYCAFMVIFIIECNILQPVVSEINHNDFLTQLKIPQCRKDCLDKVSSTKTNQKYFVVAVSSSVRLASSQIHFAQIKLERHFRTNKGNNNNYDEIYKCYFFFFFFLSI